MKTPQGFGRIPFCFAVVVLLMGVGSTVFGQGGTDQQSPVSQEHQHQGQADRDADPPPVPQDHQHHGGAARTEVGLFPLREASGTSWQPETGPMHGVHRAWRGWEVMLHGHVFGQFIYEPGDRHRTGGTANSQISSVNWAMGMARRAVGAGRVGVRGMVSVEPWTVTDCGYLNLLATGEICDGDTIHDRQHPHDLIMELAADYDRPLRGTLRLQVYGGLAGEPALGPGGFPHRLSAMANPVAPISHHWMDSTHITYGLVTGGVYDKRWKAEMSVFNGREPDDRRWDLDLGPLDSVSGRLSLLPTPRLALQVSAAHLREAEPDLASGPRQDVTRATASAAYHRPVGAGAIWATTLAWGVNSGHEDVPGRTMDTATHALLLESSVTLGVRDTWFGRAELVEKPAHDLHAHEYEGRVFTVGKLQLGYLRGLGSWGQLSPGIGGTVTLSVVPFELGPRYSGRVAPGFVVFFSLLPSRHSS